MQYSEEALLHGKKIYDLAAKIFPYCRSVTGDGVRQTLKDLSDYISEDDGIGFTLHEIPSGTRVFDWKVPKEWIIREAYIEREDGTRIIDMKENNLHVMGYSVAVDEWVNIDELLTHVYTEPSQPEVIPYVTSYYKERFGFCMSENLKQLLIAEAAGHKEAGDKVADVKATDIKSTEPRYHMFIDSELIDGSLTYADIIIPGESDKEIFFSTYDCHPSMADNECSGPALMCELIKYVKNIPDRRYTYRFAIVTETVGSITYLATENHLDWMKEKTVAGFNMSCVGDDNEYSMIPSKYGNTLADKALRNVLKFHTNDTYSKYTYRDRGSDERQYTAPGVDLPVVCFCRSKFGLFPEYHTSADNMDFVSPEGFAGAYEVMTQVIEALEHNYKYVVTVLGEPQLGPRGLYTSGDVSRKGIYDTILVQRDVLSYADGTNDVFDLSEYADAPVSEIIPIIDRLVNAGLFEKK